MSATLTASAVLRRQDLAVMGQILLAGYQAGPRSAPTHCTSLTAALRAGLIAAPDLLPAMADDVALTFGVRVDQLAICGVTPAVASRRPWSRWPSPPAPCVEAGRTSCRARAAMTRSTCSGPAGMITGRPPIVSWRP